MFRAPTVEGDGYAPSPIRLRVLSLGAGVQSTTLTLMAAHGIVGPMPDLAIFADTGWEPASVYEHLRWLMSPNVLPFPVHIVSAGNIREKSPRCIAGRALGLDPSIHPRDPARRPGEDRDDPPSMHRRLQDRADPQEGP